jgi:Zn-dependent alcohol dehydrogenase
MRAALLEEAGKPLNIVSNVDVEDPAPGHVLVKVSHCGICHSDLTAAEAGGGPMPLILGHEAAGVVEAVGTGVTSLSRGDQVVLTPLAPCGVCYFCVRDQPTLCVDAQNFMTGTMLDGTTPFSREGADVYRGFGVGGFGEFAMVTENGAVKIDPDVPLEVACVIGCAIQTGVGAVFNTAKVEPGASVLVTGLGGIGLSIVQGARIAGASRIIVSDPVAERRDYAANFGATDILDPAEVDVPARARELTGGIGVDYAFDGAGYIPLIRDCLAASRNGGMTIMVGASMGMESLPIDLAALFITQEKALKGSLLGSCHSHRDVPRFLALWKRGVLQLESMISARRPLAEIEQGFQDMRAGRGIRTVLEVA